MFQTKPTLYSKIKLMAFVDAQNRRIIRKIKKGKFLIFPNTSFLNKAGDVAHKPIQGYYGRYLKIKNINGIVYFICLATI